MIFWVIVSVLWNLSAIEGYPEHKASEYLMFQGMNISDI